MSDIGRAESVDPRHQLLRQSTSPLEQQQITRCHITVYLLTLSCLPRVHEYLSNIFSYAFPDSYLSGLI